jgi:polysaccharide pyruvyl transferase WcaK-like protein
MMEAVFPASNPRTAAIGIGFGPFVENSKQMRRTKELLARMDYVAVRDIDSYDLCKKWGCNNVSLCSDLCYLPDFRKAYAPDSRIHNMTGEIRKIGVIPRDWPHTCEGDSYAFPLFQVVDELRSTGKEVEFISFARSSDSEWAKRLKDKDEQFKSWNPEKSTISEFMELLSGYDAFITARYHGAVFASILGKPVVCIEVEQKLRLVSDLFGNGARLWTYPFSASECLRHISDLEGDYSRSVEYLARVVEEQGALAEKMVDDFRQFISTNYKTDM